MIDRLLLPIALGRNPLVLYRQHWSPKLSAGLTGARLVAPNPGDVGSLHGSFASRHGERVGQQEPDVLKLANNGLAISALVP